MKEIPLAHFIEWKKIEDQNIDSMMRKLADVGAKNIVLHPTWAKREMTEKGFLKKIKEKMNKIGLVSSACHGLWERGFELNCPEDEIHRNMIKAHADFIEKSADIGCLTYTVHPGNLSIGYNEIRKSIDKLLPLAERAGIKIAMENMINYDTSIELVEFVSEYKSPFLGLCFDTGHAHVKEGVKEALENMKSYLITCHLHDNDGCSDQHFPPGRGTIDWNHLVSELKSCPVIVNAETEAGPSEDLSTKDMWMFFNKTWKNRYI